MSKRNNTITDTYDHEHRRRFVAKAREEAGLSRQQARNAWTRRVRNASIGRYLDHLFNEVGTDMNKGGAS